MLRKNTTARRRKFLIDSNQRKKRKTKKFRNRTLNFFAKVLLIRQIVKVFRASVLIGIFIALMAAFVAFAFFSPFFDLKEISVIRDSPNLDVEQIEKTLEDFYGRNLLFMSHKSLKETLFEAFPEFREIDINEKWPDTIELKIKLSLPIFNLLNVENANFSVITEDGVVLAENADEFLLTIKVYQYDRAIKARQKFISREFLRKIKEGKALLETLELPVKEMRYLYDAKEVHYVSRGDMVIWVDIQRPVEKQIEKLEHGSGKIRLYSKEFDHIDLRIPEQIFWEWK